MKRWIWGGAAIWLVVVVTGAAMAWLAIDRAGRQVTATEPLTAAPVTTPVPTASVSTPVPTAPSSTPVPSPTPTPDSTPQAPTTRPPRPTSTGSPSPVSRYGTWNGTAGSVTVACAGSRGRLVGATPADGWRVERTDSGSEVRVRFERPDGEVRVRASCSDLGPTFQVESRNERSGED